MNLTDSAVARARRRRTLTVSVGVAGVVAALMVGTPLALAVSRDAPPSAPADQPPVNFPSPVPSPPVDLPSPVPISPVPFPPVDPKGPGAGS
ncbi:hypothetical protein [Micromonospora gifhornensis]|nr:hypothetical protein [Micromonospora gifhornensis]